MRNVNLAHAKREAAEILSDQISRRGEPSPCSYATLEDFNDAVLGKAREYLGGDVYSDSVIELTARRYAAEDWAAWLEAE